MIKFNSLSTTKGRIYKRKEVYEANSKASIRCMCMVAYLHWNSYVEMFVLKQPHFSRSAGSPEDDQTNKFSEDIIYEP